MKAETFKITLLLFLCPIFLNAQDTITTYYNRKWEKCDKKFAIYYRKAYPDSSKKWVVKDYHMNGQLQMLGTYSDKRLKKQQGLAIFYHYNGKISTTGQYLNNKEVGVWKSYYTDGRLAAEGKKSNDKNDSIWTYYNLDGSILGKINYDKGKAEGESNWFYSNGRLCELATYKRGKIIKKINYDESGNIVENPEEDCSIEYPGGNDKLYSLLKKNLKYPEELRLRGKEGVVMFHFIVRKDGKIDNVEFQKSDEPLFNEEALRVFSLIKYMKPARFHGQIIEKEATLPINFKLTY